MASPKPDATEAYSMESKKAQGAMNDALSNALTTAAPWLAISSARVRRREFVLARVPQVLRRLRQDADNHAADRRLQFSRRGVGPPIAAGGCDGDCGGAVEADGHDVASEGREPLLRAYSSLVRGRHHGM